MPTRGAVSTTRRTASAPARCPALRGSPRAVAQRPLPSMMMATWGWADRDELLCVIKSVGKKKSAIARLARRADERLHVREILLEHAAAGGGETKIGVWNAPFERLRARDVPCVFELARVHAEIAVSRPQQLLQVVERQRLVHCQRAHDPEPDPLVNEPIEREGVGVQRLTAHAAKPFPGLGLGLVTRGGTVLRHHASWR